MSSQLEHLNRPITPALIEMRGLTREFPAGDGVIAVLKNINITIQQGEMLAIVGQSGSGKSTLMNILGCLDKPTRGQYFINGVATATLEVDELARLRREHFGFIFQRYHLLGELSAVGNVEIPAIYAGVLPEARKARAISLLTRLGLAERLVNKPGQLSGGQQQRVSIARALMNGGDVILADEPTGALDRQSGAEVMAILKELHTEGHTIIIVTHDLSVAQHASRIIELSDGEVVSDRQNNAQSEISSTMSDNITNQSVVEVKHKASRVNTHQKSKDYEKAGQFSSLLDRFLSAFQMALRAMYAHKLRTFLTMLGIIIGIASVVAVVALGKGSREKVLSSISGLGTNTISIYSGSNFGDPRNGKIKTLVPADADAIAAQPYVDSVTPKVRTSATLRYKNVDSSATVNGVSAGFTQVQGYSFSTGQNFDDSSVKQLRQDVVIDDNTQKALFTQGENPIGQVIMLGKLPCRVIGVLNPIESLMGADDSLNVYLPYTTVMSRMMGQSYLRSITVRIKDGAPSTVAEVALTQLLTSRHGAEDVFTQNSDAIRKTIEKTTATMTLMVSAIAVIALIVGGIGVMNIMLVSVTERTQEIGVRMAVGARQSDILQQFLIEAVLVCLVGGILGIALALFVGALFAQLASADKLSMSFSTLSMVLAFACSSLIGVLFGFLPARNAARLDPVAALSRE